MYQNCCKKCGSISLHTETKGNNVGLYCNNCGAKNPDNSKFCSACGTKLYTQDEPQTLSNSNQLFTVEIFRESQMFLINPPIY